MLGQGLTQLYAFLALFSVGALMALPYLFACGFLKSRLAAVIFDCLYGALAIYILWQTNLTLNNGECRFFVFLGFFGGAVIATVICKSTLDKWSDRLYNLITSQKAVQDNGKTVLQKEIRRSNGSAHTGTGVSVPSTTGIPGAADSAKDGIKPPIATNRKRQGRRAGKTTRPRLPRRERIHNSVGGKDGLAQGRRHRLARTK